MTEPRTSREQDEILAKAVKLLEALVEPCNAPPDTPDGDHSWRLCRRCMAIRQFDFAPDVTRILVERVLAALRVTPPASADYTEPPKEMPVTAVRQLIIDRLMGEIVMDQPQAESIADVLATIICPHCGGFSPGDVKSCGACIDPASVTPPASAPLITECCDLAVHPDQRYCPRCGWEARVREPLSRAAPAPGDPLAPSPVEGKTQSWAVTVERNGESVVAIADRMLAGRDLSAEDARVIREAAQHLLSFVGPAPG